ncbi:hypothetical protein CON65_24880 [Bacillus pseudomycoides]|uniref:Uncharacterized protein n=1 Tax=Bacillus pseudomycoides TaxID=64104 RepID=A0AA91V7J6_9BACI|nr:MULTISPECIES: hypothetical protein [Bacillus]PEB51380.1 hypothetical protein COO03_17265 [Bacillus sp. AFS098217]PED80053.1 hypothetical protein CON65_24880 [Bacillus pseudomycoides]PEU07006.1 hypothetical protein CN524_21955 [Bacillus sp. AFS019443]PEU20960.1 hypothetical protein CN525_03365 [Bacillus sp. AFS014408]PFW55222.1 hypothetical protein COL20_27350 [Bacillus sp. AFS075034]
MNTYGNTSDLLVLNLVGGFIALLIGGIVYYRNPKQKFFLVLTVIGIVSVITTGIRMFLKYMIN